jgi:hypothetical protein
MPPYQDRNKRNKNIKKVAKRDPLYIVSSAAARPAAMQPVSTRSPRRSSGLASWRSCRSSATEARAVERKNSRAIAERRFTVPTTALLFYSTAALMPTPFHTSRFVEFSDTDMAGIMHFSAYFRYMEAAEHELRRPVARTCWRST